MSLNVEGTIYVTSDTGLTILSIIRTYIVLEYNRLFFPLLYNLMLKPDVSEISFA